MERSSLNRPEPDCLPNLRMRSRPLHKAGIFSPGSLKSTLAAKARYKEAKPFEDPGHAQNLQANEAKNQIARLASRPARRPIPAVGATVAGGESAARASTAGKSRWMDAAQKPARPD